MSYENQSDRNKVTSGLFQVILVVRLYDVFCCVSFFLWREVNTSGVTGGSVAVVNGEWAWSGSPHGSGVFLGRVSRVGFFWVLFPSQLTHALKQEKISVSVLVKSDTM